MKSPSVPSPIGESVPRLDALQKVTGEAVFTDDLQFGADLLYGRILRSPHPHARIKRLDASKALALPGVKALVTGDDCKDRFGLYLKDRYTFCKDRVRYVGDPVAGIVATSERLAEQACRLVEVEYEVLEPVLDPVQGAQDGAPLLHPNLKEYIVAPFIFPQHGSNISNYFKLRKGDVEGAWSKCNVIVEGAYRVPHVQHVPIEPHITVAKFDHSGNVTLWASSQSPFAQRDLIAGSLGISPNRVRVISSFVGGGFGSKAGVSMEALAVMMAQKVPGHPVKVRLTREEEFYCSFVRQGLVSNIKIGADEDGTLLAMQTEFYWDAGAYTEYGVNITRAAGYSCTGPYDVPNVWSDSYCVYTNHPVGGPMRGFGMPEIHWGIEQTMDQVAQKLGMDEKEFRLKNCIREGSITPTGSKMHALDLESCILKAAEAIDWGKQEPASAPHKRRGKGIAIMWKAPAMPPNAGSSSIVRFNEDGTVSVGIGGQELGQGSHTVAAQIAAATLGVPMDSIRISYPVDTQYSPYEWQTVASRLTWSMGNAIREAALDARRQILELAAEHWDEQPDDLDLHDGQVISYKSERSEPLKNLVVYGLPKEDDSGWRGGPIIGRGMFMPNYVSALDPETGQGPRAVVHFTPGCQAVDLEVDIETGQITLLRVSSAFDVGKAINPDQVRAQMEGGVVQGASTTLLEHLRLENGVPVNPNFTDYRIASTVDMPLKTIPIIVEVPQDDGPWGARGIGEHSMVPTAPAIANALADAVGLRIHDLPLSAERVFKALRDKEAAT
ncbi:MAG TPA: xanthine dehydrogenase family protein molybdopterin-binding subunit [Anaerolineae bacterium]|nr:xanthine dehydrogenase family protein molybdopterin-binding subunit [Anaerolineae bacterium]